MEVLRYTRDGGGTFAYIHKCTYISVSVCRSKSTHKYVCDSSLLIRLDLDSTWIGNSRFDQRGKLTSSFITGLVVTNQRQNI